MSAVRKYFRLDQPSSKTLTCLIWHTAISRGSTSINNFNTSNLIKHLKTHHFEEHDVDHVPYTFCYSPHASDRSSVVERKTSMFVWSFPGGIPIIQSTLWLTALGPIVFEKKGEKCMEHDSISVWKMIWLNGVPYRFIMVFRTASITWFHRWKIDI